MRQLHELQPVPSVGMHDVPRESVGQHLGFGLDEENGRDSLDASVARELNIMPYDPYADVPIQNMLDSCITCKKGIHTPRIQTIRTTIAGTPMTH